MRSGPHRILWRLGFSRESSHEQEAKQVFSGSVGVYLDQRSREGKRCCVGLARPRAGFGKGRLHGVSWCFVECRSMRCHPLATTVPTSRSVEPFISLWFVWPFFKADETRRNPLCGSPEFRASRVRMTATAPRRASPAGWLQCRPQCRPKRRRAKRAAGIGRIRGARTISGRKRVPGILPECALPAIRLRRDDEHCTNIARSRKWTRAKCNAHRPPAKIRCPVPRYS